MAGRLDRLVGGRHARRRYDQLPFRTGIPWGSENTHVVERFALQRDGSVIYRFTVEDDTVWTAPWTGEYLWQASDDNVYEYACHEGNYSMGGTLRGARVLEADALSGASTGGD